MSSIYAVANLSGITFDDVIAKGKSAAEAVLTAMDAQAEFAAYIAVSGVINKANANKVAAVYALAAENRGMKASTVKTYMSEIGTICRAAWADEDFAKVTRELLAAHRAAYEADKKPLQVYKAILGLARKNVGKDPIKPGGNFDALLGIAVKDKADTFSVAQEKAIEALKNAGAVKAEFASEAEAEAVIRRALDAFPNLAAKYKAAAKKAGIRTGVGRTEAEADGAALNS